MRPISGKLTTNSFENDMGHSHINPEMQNFGAKNLRDNLRAIFSVIALSFHSIFEVRFLAVYGIIFHFLFLKFNG